MAQQVQQLLRLRHQVRSGQPVGFTVSVLSAVAAGAPALPLLDQFQYLSRELACNAKQLCGGV